MAYPICKYWKETTVFRNLFLKLEYDVREPTLKKEADGERLNGRTQFASILFLCILLEGASLPVSNASTTTGNQSLSDPISGVGDTSAPSIVATTIDYRNTGYMRQRKVFKHGNTYFVFYSDDISMVYKTSQDGQTWSDATAVRPCALSARFSIWYDGAYVHYAYNPHETNTPIYYGRGSISGSSIIWDAEQIAVPEGPGGYVYCVVATDSSGHPWIGYLDYTTYYTYVTKSSRNDGIWQTASGFPYKLTEILSNGGVSSWGSILVPLTENKVYVVYGRGGYPLNGTLWTGSNWSEEETASTSPLNNNWYAFSAIAFRDDVHVVFVSGSNLIHVKRTYGIGWGPEETVRSGSEGIDIGWFGVSLAIDSRNGDMRVFFSNHEPSPNGWVKYRRYVASTGAWSQVDLDLASNQDYPMRPSASYQVQDNEICVIWTRDSNSKDLLFAKLKFTTVIGLLNFDDYRNRMASLTPMQPSTTFYFPHYHQDAIWQTFIAVANPNDAATSVTLTFYSDNGVSVDSMSLDVGPRCKVEYLLSWLGITGTGWIKVESNLPVVGLLNFDDYRNRMGSMSGVTPASKIYFPHFHQDAIWQTFYAIVNPSDASASITITYYRTDGSVADTESLTLNPRNKTGRFAINGIGWISVESNQPIVGMLNFDDYHNRMGTIEHAIPSQMQYFPHFHQDANWQTYYAIANPSDQTATVQVTYYSEDGSAIATDTLTLNVHSKLGRFTVSGQGWIKVESTVPIVGIQNFDDYHNRMGSIVAVTSLESIVFPHFHQDSTWQTFYAIVNLGPSATFTSTYIRADGSTITSVSTTITTNSKLGRFATSGTGWLRIH